VLLRRGPDVKTVKNRMHLDFRARDLDTETNRLWHLPVRGLPLLA
jgi:hypothetical protein